MRKDIYPQFFKAGLVEKGRRGPKNKLTCTCVNMIEDEEEC